MNNFIKKEIGVPARNAYSKSFASGYTIIETMISVSVFLVVVMYGMGSLLNANLLFQKSQDSRSIIDSMNFVMDDMSRNLRTGYDYQCYRTGFDTEISSGTLSVPRTRSCDNGWAVAFEASGGNNSISSDQWVYYVFDNKIFKSIDGLNSAGIQLTPNDVVISNASIFSVLGAEPTSLLNTQQPLILIKLSGSITNKNVTTPFSLQTSVSQRLLDI